ncbi:hypothetical protein ACFE04_011524 [Oxalis oulophora]
MENHIKRVFRSSFGSCRPKNLSDTIEKAVNNTHFDGYHHHHKPPRPFPSICKITNQVNDSSIIPKHCLSDQHKIKVPPVSPISPYNAHFVGPAKSRKTNKKKKSKKSKSRNRSSRDLGDHFFTASSSFDTSYFDDWWFSSSSGENSDTDREYEKNTLFSSKSFSSGSSRRFRRRPTTVKRKSEVVVDLPLERRTTAGTAFNDGVNTQLSSKSFSSGSSHRFRRIPTSSNRKPEVGMVFPEEKTITTAGAAVNDNEVNTLLSSNSLSSGSSGTFRRRPTSANSKSEVGMVTPLERRTTVGAGDKMKDSFAVVKSSSDPYNDFRTSMVEMIIEKQIFATKDLEKLLHCYLGLNCDRHHRIILHVFMEIWDALFLDWV